MTLSPARFIQAAEANINDTAIGMGFTADHAIHPGSMSAFVSSQWSSYTPVGVSNGEYQDQDTANAPDVVNHMALGWAKCPENVRYNIIRWAVRATNGSAHMPCLTDRTFEPKYNLGLLRVNREIHFEALKYLYRDNVFVFDNIGSDIANICQGFAHFDRLTHTFEHVVFMVGDENSFDLGEFKIDMFAKMLRNLKTNFRTNHLTICLLRRSFIDDVQCTKFALSLGRLKIYGGLNIWCDNVHLQLPLDRIARALGMGPRQTGAASFLPLKAGPLTKNLVYSKMKPTVGPAIESKHTVGPVIESEHNAEL